MLPSLTAQQALEQLTWEGAERRYPEGVPDKVVALIKHELRLIETLRYAPYFLTVNAIVQFARSRDILCQGRGSAANSAVCYVLGITACRSDDRPAHTNVLGETGLNPTRLEVEISAKALVSDIVAAREGLDAFHQEGVRIALADFGTGNSSLQHLRVSLRPAQDRPLIRDLNGHVRRGHFPRQRHSRPLQGARAAGDRGGHRQRRTGRDASQWRLLRGSRFRFSEAVRQHEAIRMIGQPRPPASTPEISFGFSSGWHCRKTVHGGRWHRYKGRAGRHCGEASARLATKCRHGSLCALSLFGLVEARPDIGNDRPTSARVLRISSAQGPSRNHRRTSASGTPTSCSSFAW